ncbi:MAG: hypothetical protein A2086_12985 [Spirochaetes bacterium GWD1_27_9]|nr:MAG: hypothetical protein A2Z98_13480 [Spirochaetes bacterium GWB1_27_13]OHD23925.1 MAG: hypothetical protein A2Y34_18675 [Spirochaetes bacterium GWC1_27_15]OHD43576.1 MAG: hypothetical protein A2086_12985 [Spirochaetes bacterium GWD1_27_9]
MQDIDLIFEKLVKELHKKIFASEDTFLINKEIDYIYNFIKTKWKDLEFFKRFDSLIEVILIQRVLKDKEYTDTFLKKYLNIYFELLNLDFYNFWGVLFSKILKNKTSLIYPSIYVVIFKLVFEKESYSYEKSSFPLRDDISLYETLSFFTSKIEEIVVYSSSYNLFFNPKLRNPLILFLYEFYKTNKQLYVWFPLAGLSIEPVLFSYLLHLIIELDKNTTNPESLNFYGSDHSNFIVDKDKNTSFFEDSFLKVKKDFCFENGIDTKDIKTTLKDSKKKVLSFDFDFIYKTQIIDRKINFVIINSLKLSDFDNEKEKINKILKKIIEFKEEIGIILEIYSGFPLKEENIELPYTSNKKIISTVLISDFRDYYVSYLYFTINKNNIQKEEKNIDILFNNYQSLKIEQLKEELKKFDLNSSFTKKETLMFAEILTYAGFHSRAYEILKKNYKVDFNYSYKILNKIQNESKNQKIVNSVSNFIKENKIKEKGFTGELLDAIIEEIDTYFKENPNSTIKNKWV